MMRARVLWSMVLMLWAGSVAVGFIVLMGYQNAPGKPAAAPSAWPATAVLEPTAGQGTLVVFAHPRCACTRATLGELERLFRQATGRVRTYVVFVRPAAYSAQWVRQSVLWRRAASLPGVQPVIDTRGRLAERFGAFTSGQVLYYDARRQLRFAGGITGSRGHEGDNKGRQALTAALLSTRTKAPARPRQSFVFGCALQPAPVNAWKSFDFTGRLAATERLP